jgi:hypothetical protein
MAPKKRITLGIAADLDLNAFIRAHTGGDGPPKSVLEQPPASAVTSQTSSILSPRKRPKYGTTVKISD